MRLVKRVDLEITPLGEVVVTENPAGNHRVYNTTIEKDTFKTTYDFVEFLQTYVLPGGFSTYHTDNVVTIKCDSPSYEIKFRFNSVNIGIIGKDFQESYDNSYNQLFFYHWGAPMNTLSFFIKLHELGKWAYEAEIVATEVRKRIPKMLWIRPHKEGDVGDYELGLRNYYFHREGYFIINVKDGKMFLKRWEHDVCNETWIDAERKSVKDLEMDIKTYQANIRRAEEQIKIMQWIDQRLQMTEEDLKKEVTEEIMKKEERKEYFRNRPRNPLLAKYHTRELVDALNKNYSSFFTAHDITEDDVRTELSYRPHLPNKQERKENRQRAASQRHRGEKISRRRKQ